jgi:hypothetical protein
MKVLTAVIVVCALACIGCSTTPDSGQNMQQGYGSDTANDTFGTGTGGSDTGIGAGAGGEAGGDTY